MKQKQKQGVVDSIQLPSLYYTDPDIFQLELSRIFINGWVSVAVASQLPLPGDVYPVTIAGQLLLLTRGEDGVIRVFNNLCRHRGMKLVEEPCSQRNGLVTCPYHHWSYDLGGELRSTPYWDRTAGSAPDRDLASTLGLVRINAALWFDTVFVNISGQAQPFEEFIRPLAERWSTLDASQLRPSMLRTDYRPQANWKLVCENFLDGYHVPWVHSQVGPPEAGINFRTALFSEDIFGACVPRGKSERPRSTLSLPGFTNLSDELKEAHHFLYVFPNTLIALAPEWFQVISVFPESAEHSSENLAFYVVGETAAGEEYRDLRVEYNEQMALINDQDMDILAGQQSARYSLGSEHCTFAPHWDELAAIFHRRIAHEHKLQTRLL